MYASPQDGDGYSTAYSILLTMASSTTAPEAPQSVQACSPAAARASAPSLSLNRMPPARGPKSDLGLRIVDSRSQPP